MSELHKKCFFASAGAHALLFLVLLVGPAFLMSRDTVDDDMPTLEFIPSKLIDETIARLSTPTPQPSPIPPKVQPQKEVRSKPVDPPPPKPPVKPPTTAKQEPKYTKPADIDISTATRKKPVSKATSKPQRPKDFANASERIAALAATPSIHIETTPGGGEAYANYAQMVKSVYEKHWHPPDETSRDDAVVTVQVVIAKDGTIRSARIIGRSGDASVDNSVQDTLRRVTRVRPFPAGAKEDTRTYTIGFNLKARRAIG